MRLLRCAECANDHRDRTANPSGRRRRLLALAGLGAAAGLVALPRAHASGKTEALLLSCMDYRLMDDIEKYMSGRGMRNKYDHIVLAGASLGALVEKYPAWRQTFWSHVDIAIQLHQIHKVMVMDHRDCGAYKVFLGKDFGRDREKETAAHAEQLNRLAAEIRKKYPKLEVELLLMSLDGRVEKVASAAADGKHS